MRRHLPVPLTRGSNSRFPHLTVSLPRTSLLGCLRVMDSFDLLILSALGASTRGLGALLGGAHARATPRLVNLVVAPGLIVALSKAKAAGDHALAEAVMSDAFRLMAATSALILVAAGARSDNSSGAVRTGVR